MNSTCKHRRPAGFTLVEMLVVFVIIAILIGILVPVIAAAYRNAKQAAEVVEINSLVTQLQQFKDRFAAYPPSQIVLIENGDYSPSNWDTIFGTSNGEVGESPWPACATSPGKDGVFLRSVSVQYLRRFWPQMQISETGPVSLDLDASGDTIPGQYPDDYFDWNGDLNPTPVGATPHVFFLTGDECLVFFLGGIPTGQYTDLSGTGNRPYGVGLNPKSYPPGVLGFSKEPRYPMLPPVGGTAGAGRDGPFYEFDNGRLVDRDNDGFWEFIPLRKPTTLGGYAYFSSYDGAGYRPDDFNLPTELTGYSSLPTSLSGSFIEFRVRWQRPTGYPAAYTPTYATAPLTSVLSPGPNPYTIGPPMIDAVAIDRYWKPDGFQLISPGSDGAYGQGGAIERLDTRSNRSMVTPGPAYEEVKEDNDNLSSFATTELKDAGSK